MYKLIIHPANQWGFPVSLAQFDDDDEIINGFTLNTFDTEEAQRMYATDLSKMTNWIIEGE